MFAMLRKQYQNHATFLAIFALAVTFRLLALLLFRPGGYIADAGDFEFYALWGEQIPKGYTTFVNLWTAYPPLFPAIMLPVFEWSSRIPLWDNPPLFFHLLFGLVILLFESANLILIYRLALKLGYPPLGDAVGSDEWRVDSRQTHHTSHITHHTSHITHHASHITYPLHPLLLYALLFTPVYTMLGWFEAMPLFFMLWGLDLLLGKRQVGWVASAVVAALGFLTKLTPALLVPIAVRWLGSKLSWQALRAEWFNPKSPGNLLRPTIYALLFLGVVVGGGYWLVGGHTALALSSFQVNALRPPWESVWALLIGNYDWGRVPVDMRNLVALNNPPPADPLPWTWITLAFGVLYLWLYTRPYEWNNPRTPVVFAAMSVIWLFLYSKGWSPQFLVWILAFIVLLLPTWQGIALSIGLSVINVIESPIFFTMFGNERWILVGTILLRTGLLIALGGTLLGEIWPTPVRSRQLRRFAGATTWLLLLTTLVGISVGLPRAAHAYTQQRLAAHPCREAIDYLQTEAGWPNQRIFSDQVEVWRTFYPWLHRSYEIQIIDGYDALDRPWDAMVAERLAAQVGSEEFWWVTYVDEETQATQFFAKPSVRILTEERLGACHVARVMHLPETPLAVANVQGGPIHLVALAQGSAKVGAELPLVIYWQAERPVETSYTVFVHLRNEGDDLVAQQDNLPVEGLAPTDTWEPDTLIRDPYRLTLPAELPAGEYQVQIGLYTADGRVPLVLSDGMQADQLTYALEIQ